VLHTVHVIEWYHFNHSWLHCNLYHTLPVLGSETAVL